MKHRHCLEKIERKGGSGLSWALIIGMNSTWIDHWRKSPRSFVLCCNPGKVHLLCSGLIHAFSPSFPSPINHTRNHIRKDGSSLPSELSCCQWSASGVVGSKLRTPVSPHRFLSTLLAVSRLRNTKHRYLTPASTLKNWQTRNVHMHTNTTTFDTCLVTSTALDTFSLKVIIIYQSHMMIVIPKMMMIALNTARTT